MENNDMEDAAIVGAGVVGKATAKGFGISRYFDLKGSNCTLQDVSKCKQVFICLPTPTVNGECQVEPIVDLVNQVHSYGSTPLFIIRSTVTPGTARRIIQTTGVPTVVSNPEFLSEDTADYDARHPRIVVIGSDTPGYGDALQARYEDRWKGLKIIRTDTVTAETIKYAFNSFFATKVVFANALYDLCQNSKANYQTIKESLESHPWGGKNHFDVWHKGGRGAGGRCLSKDMEAFANYSNQGFFREVNRINKLLLAEYPKT